ncbi:MAG: hypothetical protein ACRDWA_10935, partial [Acidimicrobiia bacterium]
MIATTPRTATNPGPWPRVVRRRWPRWTVDAVATLTVAGAALGRILVEAEVYLSPDGGHYLADADAVLGVGVRSLQHPPVLPVLIAAVRIFSGPVTAFSIAMFVVLAAFVGGLMAWFRTWMPRGPSLVAAAVGILTPITAELLAWGGGAMLSGFALMLWSWAVYEQWLARPHVLRAVAFGALVGATAAAHPFALVVCVGWIPIRSILAWTRRNVSRPRWGPLSLRGTASAAAAAFLVGITAYPYYRLVASEGLRLRAPSLATAWDLAVWATRETPILIWMWFLALPLALVHKRRTALAGLFTVLGFQTGFLLLLDTDVSYLTRPLYLLPVLLGSTAGILATVLGSALPPHRTRVAAGVALSVLAATSLGFNQRTVEAVPYYTDLRPEDLQIFERLAGRGGSVATSWGADAYDTGLSRSWLVEGLSRRPASGPGSNIWSTIPAQMVTAADMQRFFLGEIGAENGTLQVTAGSRMRADPAIQVWVDGAYRPVLFVDALVDTYPVTWFDTRQVSRADGLDVEFLSEQGEVLFNRQVGLEASSALVRHSTQNGSGTEGWTIYLWPAYNIHWREVQLEGNEVSLAVDYRNTRVDVMIEVLAGEVTYQ